MCGASGVLVFGCVALLVLGLTAAAASPTSPPPAGRQVVGPAADRYEY
jgi:hypothetical protein